MALTPEDLQALGSLIQDSIQPLRSDIQGVKNEITGMKVDIQDTKDDIQIMKVDIQALDKRLQKVENRITHIGLTLENETNHNIQLLAENHINLVDKLNEAIRIQDKSILYEVQVSDLKSRVEHLEQEMADIRIKIA